MHCQKKVTIIIIGLTFLFLPLSTCVNLQQPSNKIEYYTLEYDPPLFTGMNELPYAIRVERFSVTPTYDTTQIIYRDKSFTRNAFVYHKWRVNPGDMVTHFLNRDIRSSGLFKTMIPYKSKYQSSFSLVGEVDEFFERDTKDQWEAVLSISIFLITENEQEINDRILFQKSYSVTETCKQKHPRALAEAMSQAMSRISSEVISDFHSYMKEMN